MLLLKFATYTGWPRKSKPRTMTNHR